MTQRTIGVVGGSGFYKLPGLTDVQERTVETPFGPPSDAVVSGRLGDTTLLFLPRHGRGHRLTPSQINYRANIFALKKLGAQAVISVSACGSMKEEIGIGDIVIADQFFDRTHGRRDSYFDDGVAAHVQFADPVCPDLAALLADAAEGLGYKVHRGGVYLCMEGPAFSTRGESRIYRQWGVDVIGMTNIPEAKLAREAELCYATLAIPTDYDCWHDDHADVDVFSVVRALLENVKRAQAIVAAAAPKVKLPRTCGCPTALDTALITDPDAIAPATRERLGPILARVLEARGA
ncbi:MAG: S-methyl-5'-thioadenosine phosphorylase [Deltaproteobacteria bacterium]|nr:S-methyl-5'-thioadenosine phosphorylase [Deltaproteobacteria bacterium]